MEHELHPVAVHHLPFFVTPPGQTDVLFIVMVVFLVVMVLLVGNFYFHLHAVPEKLSHNASKVQMEIVAVLSLIALFTHENIFWIAALLLAMIQFPDLATPIASITKSLERIADESESRWREPRAPAEAPPSDVAATTSVSMSPADAAPPASHPPETVEDEAGGTKHARQPRAAPHS